MRRDGAFTYQCIGLAALIALCGIDVAQASGSGAICAGLSVPTGDLSSSLDNGFYVGVSGDHMVNANTAIGVDASYHVLGEGGVSQVAGLPITITENASILEAMLYGRSILLRKDTPISPYLKWGFGVDYVMAEATYFSQFVSSFRSSGAHAWLGLLGGLGVSIRLNDMNAVRVEGQFHYIESDHATEMVTVGIGLVKLSPSP